MDLHYYVWTYITTPGLFTTLDIEIVNKEE